MLPEVQPSLLMVSTEEQSHPENTWGLFRHSRLDKSVYSPAAHVSGSGLRPPLLSKGWIQSMSRFYK